MHKSKPSPEKLGFIASTKNCLVSDLITKKNNNTGFDAMKNFAL